MSIIIKGMEMPTRCAECWLMDGEDSWCTACRGRHLYPEYRYGIKDRPDWCPLVPVPPHGRLIDGDALYEHTKLRSERFNGCFNDLDNVINALYIETFPTIIPAEEGE